MVNDIVQFREVKKVGDPEFAAHLREVADRVERGELTDLVFVADDKGDKCFTSSGIFSDRWRLLGALEYAKNHVLNS